MACMSDMLLAAKFNMLPDASVFKIISKVLAKNAPKATLGLYARK